MVIVGKVRRDAPWSWLKNGLADLAAEPGISLGYGAVFTLAGVLITLGLIAAGMGGLAPVFLAGFALVAPAFAIGVYRISQVRDEGGRPQLFDFWSMPIGRITQLALLSVLLLVFFLAWARLAQFLFAMFAHGSDLSLGSVLPFLFSLQGLGLIVVGTLIGGVLALAAFTVSAIAFPMLVDQDVDAFTAIAASIKAVRNQPGVMLTWAWLIALITMLGMAAMLIGLAFAFPLIAHASWHAYKDFAPRPASSAEALAADSASDAA
ncbi:MAG: DUF2189 domain-containing protein [Glycocaulis sp.]